MGIYATIAVCAADVTSFIFTVTVFLTFFITTSLQFDACRIYMKGLVAELDDAITQCDHDDIQPMFQHIISFQVAAKE